MVCKEKSPCLGDFFFVPLMCQYPRIRIMER